MPNIWSQVFSGILHAATAATSSVAAVYDKLPACFLFGMTAHAGAVVLNELFMGHGQDKCSNLSRLVHMSAHLGTISACYLTSSFYEKTEDDYISSKAIIFAMLPSYFFHGIGFLLSAVSKFKKDNSPKKEGILAVCMALLYGSMGSVISLVLTDYAEHRYKLFFPAIMNLFEVFFPSQVNNFDVLFNLASRSDPQQPDSIDVSHASVETQLLSASPSSIFKQQRCRRHRIKTPEQNQGKENGKEKGHEVPELRPPTILVRSSCVIL